MDKKDVVVVVKLINEEILVGAGFLEGTEDILVLDKPVRYQVRGNEVFLTPFFGDPGTISIAWDKVSYSYQITDQNLVGKYKTMINKSAIKVVGAGAILSS